MKIMGKKRKMYLQWQWKKIDKNNLIGFPAIFKTKFIQAFSRFQQTVSLSCKSQLSKVTIFSKTNIFYRRPDLTY